MACAEAETTDIVVSFALEFQTQFGESLCLVVHGGDTGSHSWHEMVWTEGHVWTLRLCLAPTDVGLPLHYHYCVVPTGSASAASGDETLVHRHEDAEHALCVPHAGVSRSSVRDWWGVGGDARCTALVVRHPLHAAHELRLATPRFFGHWRCDNPECVAGRHRQCRAWDCDQYRCDKCDFDLCPECALAPPTMCANAGLKTAEL